MVQMAWPALAPFASANHLQMVSNDTHRLTPGQHTDVGPPLLPQPGCF